MEVQEQPETSGATQGVSKVPQIQKENRRMAAEGWVGHQGSILRNSKNFQRQNQRQRHLAREIRGKKRFYKYTAQKRKAKEAVSQLLINRTSSLQKM